MREEKEQDANAANSRRLFGAAQLPRAVKPRKALVSRRQYPFTFQVFAFLIIGTVIAVCFEMLSYLYLRMRIGDSYRLHIYHPALGYFHVPNLRLDYRFEERGRTRSRHEIAINSKGLRDKERPYRKGDGVYRILALGDSMLVAHQTPEERRFTDLLETELNRQARGLSYEVINAGVSGYSTALELLLFEHEGYKYQPNLVILALYLGNDIFENSRELRRRFPYIENRVYQPYFVVEKGKLSVKNFPVNSSLFARSSAYRLISNVTGKYAPGFVRWMNRIGLLDGWPLAGEFERNGIPFYVGVFSTHNDQKSHEAWRITQALLRELRDEVRRRGAQLIVLLIPHELQLGDRPAWAEVGSHRTLFDWRKPNRILKNWLTQEDIPSLDLLSYLEKHEMTGGRGPFNELDFHLSQLGHHLVAKALLEFLKDGGYIPPEGPALTPSNERRFGFPILRKPGVPW